MIRIFNSATYCGIDGDERFIPLDEVNIQTQNIHNGVPYILFEHKDFPLGALNATFDGTYWQCDLD